MHKSFAISVAWIERLDGIFHDAVQRSIALRMSEVEDFKNDEVKKIIEQDDDNRRRVLRRFVDERVSEKEDDIRRTDGYYISAVCSDGTSIRDASFDEIRKANFGSRIITKFSANSSHSSKIRIDIDLTRRGMGPVMEAEISGDDGYIFYVERQIRDLFDEAKVWWWLAGRVSPLYFAFYMYAFDIVVFSAAAVFIAANGITEDVQKNFASIFSLMLMAPIFGSALYWIVCKIMFPQASFIIGKGERRFMFYKNIRAVVGVAVILSFIVGLVVNYVSGLLF